MKELVTSIWIILRIEDHYLIYFTLSIYFLIFIFYRKFSCDGINEFVLSTFKKTPKQFSQPEIHRINYNWCVHQIKIYPYILTNAPNSPRWWTESYLSYIYRKTLCPTPPCEIEKILVVHILMIIFYLWLTLVNREKFLQFYLKNIFFM